VDKQAILIQKDGKCIKWFKVWSDNGSAKIEITGKKKNGEKYKVVKRYISTPPRVAMIICCEAVMKYWKNFDPQKHEMVISTGHFSHIDKGGKVAKKKKKKRS